jgi:hypothetical protein
MFSVLASYLKYHYGRAYVEGFHYLRPHGLALGVVGIPLAIIWTLLPLVIASLLFSGIYLAFIWSVL